MVINFCLSCGQLCAKASNAEGALKQGVPKQAMGGVWGGKQVYLRLAEPCREVSLGRLGEGSDLTTGLWCSGTEM